jgi:hypothetical protein
VDLPFVRNLVRGFYSDRGAPSVDPVVVFKMSSLGYFYGISSERRLAEECGYNFFAEIVRKCRDKGLMDGDRVFLDARRVGLPAAS